MTKQQKSPFQNRTYARMVAFQALYQEDMNSGTMEDFGEEFIYTELQQLCPQTQVDTPMLEGDELESLRSELVNEGSESTIPISYDELLDLVKFVKSLVHGTLEHREEIDQAITNSAQNWTIARMAATDRNVLRMAVYEMKWYGTPKAVVIHEAIELGKKFGAGTSLAFLNGILDSIKITEVGNDHGTL